MQKRTLSSTRIGLPSCHRWWGSHCGEGSWRPWGWWCEQSWTGFVSVIQEDNRSWFRVRHPLRDEMPDLESRNHWLWGMNRWVTHLLHSHLAFMWLWLSCPSETSDANITYLIFKRKKTIGSEGPHLYCPNYWAHFRATATYEEFSCKILLNFCLRFGNAILFLTFPRKQWIFKIYTLSFCVDRWVSGHLA